MVDFKTVEARNGTLHSRGPGLVAVFVGGTSGIALATAKAFARHAQAPNIVLVGRSRNAADAAVASMKALNPSARVTFLQSDLTLLKNVDRVCSDIKALTPTLNLLFMTCGQMTMHGRRPTLEGLDQKLVLHFYARMRFIANLMPLLTAAAGQIRTDLQRPASPNAPQSPSAAAPQPQPQPLSRVVSVLDPYISVRFGGSGRLDYTDLSLHRSFSLSRAQMHASLMGNFYLEGLAARHPATSFVHSYPGGVDTGLLRDTFPGSKLAVALLRPFMRPFMVPLDESGERHLFEATSGCFPPAAASKAQALVGADGVQSEAAPVAGDSPAVGSDGIRGSGCYWTNWDDEVWPESEKLRHTREGGAVQKVRHHVDQVFQRVCDEGGVFDE